ncbi:site-specific recombinase resolvase [Nitrosomonas eutropha]|uniref:site-specific recombinase resolvase n=2 Tax=Nitrosomonas TaxID=914 RepID=UPI001C431213|nr:site-specific recombinase resolvase [Nitrosomonas eutropha]
MIRSDGESSSPTARGQFDSPMLVALARAFYWQQLLDDGVVTSGTDIAQREGLHHSTVNELLRLTLLEPAIIQSILAGQQPRCMSLIWFQRNPLPLDWIEQRRVVDGFDA